MTKNREKLLKYIPMANYIAAMNGPRAESLIHDISDYNHSIVYITPNSITGRKVGGFLTDYAIQLLNNKVYEQADHVVNYLGRSSINNLILRSSTYFIKDNGQVIGLLCTNIDITEQIRAAEIMKESMLVDFDNLGQSQPAENFSMGTEELINKVYAKALSQMEGKKLTLPVKRSIVYELAASDVFMLKRAVSSVAALLKVSEKTIYRYINEAKKERGISND